MDDQKICCKITAKEHRELVLLANEHGTTIGNIAAFAVREAIFNLKRNPALAQGIDPDRRRTP